MCIPVQREPCKYPFLPCVVLFRQHKHCVVFYTGRALPTAPKAEVSVAARSRPSCGIVLPDLPSFAPRCFQGWRRRLNPTANLHPIPAKHSCRALSAGTQCQAACYFPLLGHEQRTCCALSYAVLHSAARSTAWVIGDPTHRLFHNTCTCAVHAPQHFGFAPATSVPGRPCFGQYEVHVLTVVM